MATKQKSLQVIANPRGPHFIIAWEGGGEVPEALSGFWTSQEKAEIAINTYLRERDKPTAKAS